MVTGKALSGNVLWSAATRADCAERMVQQRPDWWAGGRLTVEGSWQQWPDRWAGGRLTVERQLPPAGAVEAAHCSDALEGANDGARRMAETNQLRAAASKSMNGQMPEATDNAAQEGRVQQEMDLQCARTRTGCKLC